MRMFVCQCNIGRSKITFSLSLCTKDNESRAMVKIDKQNKRRLPTEDLN